MTARTEAYESRVCEYGKDKSSIRDVNYVVFRWIANAGHLFPELRGGTIVRQYRQSCVASQKNVDFNLNRLDSPMKRPSILVKIRCVQRQERTSSSALKQRQESALPTRFLYSFPHQQYKMHTMLGTNLIATWWSTISIFALSHLFGSFRTMHLLIQMRTRWSDQ